MKSNSSSTVIIIGIIIISLGLFFAYRSYTYTKGATATTGRVIAYIDVIDECFPVVNFKTLEGKTIEFVNANKELNLPFIRRSNATKTQYGDHIDGCFLQTLLLSKDGIVPVLYQGDKPEQAVINNFFSRAILSTSLFIIGLLTILAGMQLKRKN